MGGGESEKEEEEEEDWPAPRVTGARLVDAPVLFFVATHKAFRGELSSLHRAAAEAAVSGAVGRELVVDLRRRLEFLKLVFNCHCSAEDEVIFLALDAQVKNVVPTYSLEHKSIEDNFSSIFRHLDRVINTDEDSQMFQELLFSIGTVQTMICQHMHKEEEQVFPLVMKKFNPEQQSQLVWQYICSVPTVLLEEFFPWMTLYLTKDEKLDLIHCINLILPKERLLQEVFVSWIQREESSYKAENIYYRKGCELLNLLSDSKLIAPQIHGELGQQLDKVCSVPIKGVYLWHAALRRDFDQILEELYEIRSSDCFSSLSSVVVQIKFIADSIIFYSNSLDKFFYQFLDIAKNSVSSCSPLIDEYQIKCLRSLLYYKCQDLSQLEMLCQELESLVNGLAGKLAFLETEIFPSIIETCTAETQLWLLYTSLSTMPLGMLKCTVSWFSAHLTDNQSNCILNNVKMGCHSISNSFTSLLHEWVRIARSGKISTEKFRQNLIETFNGRTFYLSEQNRTIILSDHKRASSSNGMNLHTFYKTMPPLQTNPVISDNDANFPKLDSRPMDLVFYIHRALVEDLKYLVSLSAKLSENPGLFPEFKNRFDIFHNIYQIHSNSEDEIAFPALESKGALRNISHSYCIDHKLEVKHFTRISTTLNEISELHGRGIEHYRLCLKLHDTCMAMHKVLSDHIYREEVEIFPLFRQCFSIEEEGKILGQMLGRTRAEAIQEMLPWLMTYLTSDEQNAVMSSWLKIARNTKFDEWLGEWWEGMTRYNNNNVSTVEYSPSVASDPLEVVSTYLLKEVGTRGGGAEKEFHFENVDEPKFGGGVEEKGSKKGKTRCGDVAEIGNNKECRESNNKEHPLNMTQEELEATIRRVSRDSNLDSQKKSHIIQNLLMSRWIITQKMSSQESSPVGNHEGEIPGQSPSYRDPHNLTFGCSHYKRNCKLVAPCCNKLYTCIRCHDELTDHSVDRKAITKMMCMKCMVIQPVGPKCTSQSCNGFSMARYYCKICKLFDDERQIYHCPYCNLCRLGKGLGIDYFHCMKCNACMSKLLFVHVCREKCLEDNCPICHEYIFTSNSPVKALPCGHLMHSSCFQDYTCSHYVCPICSKSLGDMQVYFGMLDALLAEEKMPEEYSGQTQVILCNDCEKRGTASFHWLYHKCPNCGSYNTRLL